MKILVCGGRDLSDSALVFRVLTPLLREKGVDRLVHGDATGADRIASSWAKSHNIPDIAYPADWETYGKAAGPIRNALVLAFEAPDLVVAFPGGRGTADMLFQATKAGIDTMTVDRKGSITHLHKE